MPKRFLIISVLLNLATIACAQRMAGQVVVAETGKPLPRTTCKLVTQTDSLLSYCIAGNDGSFALLLPPKADAAIFSCMGYESQRIDKAQLTEKMEIRMERAAHALPDVIVKAPAIIRRKDTLDYNVASFVGKNDKHLEDVIKKMPGLEVLENGTIRYQGKAIGGFQIEGQNLLGGRYNQATQNMPVEAVATVQVMENDQHVRALKDKVFSDKTTLNIKLKRDYKTKPFGEAAVSAGGFRPFAWDGRLTLLNIAAKNQTLITTETNSTGRRLSGFSPDHFDMASLRSTHLVPMGMLDDITLRLLPLKAKRHTDNRSYSIGANHLFALSRYSSLVVNLSYINDRETDRDSTCNEFGGTTTFRLSETNRLTKRSHTMLPTVKYELNANKIYLEDELKASVSKTTADNRMQSNGRPTDNALTRRPDYIQNHLQMIVNTGSKVVSLHSLVRYYDDHEQLRAPFVRHLRHRQLLAEHSVGTSFSLLRNMLGLEYSNEYLREDYFLSANETANSLFIHTLRPNYQLNKGRSSLSIALPVSFASVRIPWKPDSNADRVYLSPSVSWNYRPNAFLILQLGAAYKETAADEPLLNESYYSNYRTLHTTADRTGWTKRWSTTLSLSYQSILHLMTWYFLANASWDKRDHYFAYSYTPEATLRLPVWEDNRQRSLFVQTSLQKAFAKGVSLKTSLSYNSMELLTAQNGTVQTFRSNALSLTADFIYAALSWMNLSCSATGNVGWYAHRPETRMKSLYTDLSLSLYPVAHLALTASLDYHLSEISQGVYRHNSFVDVSAEYTPGRRLGFSLRAVNLLDQREYVNTSVSVLNYGYFSKPLRGREVLFGISWKF